MDFPHILIIEYMKEVFFMRKEYEKTKVQVIAFNVKEDINCHNGSGADIDYPGHGGGGNDHGHHHPWW